MQNVLTKRVYTAATYEYIHRLIDVVIGLNVISCDLARRGEAACVYPGKQRAMNESHLDQSRLTWSAA